MDKSRTVTSTASIGKSPFATVEDTTKTAHSNNVSSTIKHSTGEETFDDPQRGPVKYKKETVLQEEKKVSQQVTESHKVVTGRLEDVLPVIQKEAERYGHPQGQEVKLPSSTNPIISSESRKTTYTTSTGSSRDQVPVSQTVSQMANQTVKPRTSDASQPSPKAPYASKLAPSRQTQFVNNNSPGMSPTSSPAEQMMSSKTRTVETVTVSSLNFFISPLVDGI